ncbi:DUF6153 family protein [Streptomyces indiaensis]|uniref:DUF6153 family protein n=1 Tax=Streptomyces indiaensis TaxID=284033 RepID=A0ABP5QD95_9ACTN|nr:DUF6153 family protein [Streptomyces indiaensis]MCF1644532.1 DUF6153 family protein [Streptomyces indiaensis]
MIAAVQRTPSRRPAGRGFVLLVLAVLAGVLAMHGFGPAPAPTAQGHQGHVRHAVPASAPHGAPSSHTAVHEAVTDRACSHSAGGTEHLAHADGTCAAAGVASPYAPPQLAAALDAVSAPPVLPGSTGGGAWSGRAPPDLAELQLLRI